MTTPSKPGNVLNVVGEIILTAACAWQLFEVQKVNTLYSHAVLHPTFFWMSGFLIAGVAALFGVFRYAGVGGAIASTHAILRVIAYTFGPVAFFLGTYFSLSLRQPPPILQLVLCLVALRSAYTAYTYSDDKRCKPIQLLCVGGMLLLTVYILFPGQKASENTIFAAYRILGGVLCFVLREVLAKLLPASLSELMKRVLMAAAVVCFGFSNMSGDHLKVHV